MTEKNVLSLEDIDEVLIEASFERNEQNDILEENPNIFFLSKKVLVESIQTLVRYFNNYKLFRQMVLDNPRIIGITNENYLEIYINESEE